MALAHKFVQPEHIRIILAPVQEHFKNLCSQLAQGSQNSSNVAEITDGLAHMLSIYCGVAPALAEETRKLFYDPETMRQCSNLLQFYRNMQNVESLVIVKEIFALLSVVGDDGEIQQLLTAEHSTFIAKCQSGQL